MTRFQPIFSELRKLQQDLQETVDRLWRIKLSLSSFYSSGQSIGDFMPRRLVACRREEQSKFQKMMERLNHLVIRHLDGSIVVYQSREDQEAVEEIRKTIRTLCNSFAGDLPLGENLARLNLTLTTSLSPNLPN